MTPADPRHCTLGAGPEGGTATRNDHATATASDNADKITKVSFALGGGDLFPVSVVISSS